MGRKEEKTIKVVCIVTTMLMLLVALVFAGYSLPAADDFSNACSVRELITKTGSFLSAAIIHTKELYLSTSGYFFAAFLNFICQPFLRGGILGVKVFNIIALMFYYAALFVLVKTFNALVIKGDNVTKWLIFAVSVFCNLNLHVNSETNTWYCVIVAYHIPLALMYLGCAALIDGSSNNKNGMLVFAAISGFLVCGSSLNVTALVCGCYLLITIWAWFNNHNRNKLIAVFCVTIAGAFVNVLSPGNYIRHDSVNESYSLLKSCAESILAARSHFIDVCVTTPIVILLILMFFIARNRINVKLNTKNKAVIMIIATIIVLGGLVLVVFPVCFGYSTQYIPERAVFIEDIAFMVLSISWMFLLMSCIKNERPKSEKTSTIIVIACVVVCVGIIAFRGIEKNTTLLMSKEILTGEANNYVEYECGILEEIKTSKEKEVSVMRSQIMDNALIKGTEITSDPENWVNVAVSRYYQKKSVKLISQNQ